MSGNFRLKQCWRNLLWGVWEDGKIHEKILSVRLQHDLCLNKNCSNWGCQFPTNLTREKTHKFSKSSQETENPRMNKAQNRIIYDFLVCSIFLCPADIWYLNIKNIVFRKLYFRRSADRNVPGHGYKRDGDERLQLIHEWKLQGQQTENWRCAGQGAHTLPRNRPRAYRRSTCPASLSSVAFIDKGQRPYSWFRQTYNDFWWMMLYGDHGSGRKTSEIGGKRT